MIAQQTYQALMRANALRDGFEAQGARRIETPILQSAEILLDLYGEDIRSRAYTTSDAFHGEQMLRPDFTVPVVQAHMQGGANPARYTYCGPVFRRQDAYLNRANEYLQVGYELFDTTAPQEAEAEVFALICDALKHLRLRAATGDIGLIIAAVQGLSTTSRRKEALLRHIWRPSRFRDLLSRFAQPGGGEMPGSPSIKEDAPVIGLRGRDEIDEHLAAQAEERRTAPIDTQQLEAIESLISLRETYPIALEMLQDICVDLPQISEAVTSVKRRADAFKARGIDLETLDFEVSYGRTSMEYYDGFVFGLYEPSRPDLPPLASGGRYDALTKRLGGPTQLSAVGGVIRPDLVTLLEQTNEH